MKVEQHHRVAATWLAVGLPPAQLAPVVRGYLAAVERIEERAGRIESMEGSHVITPEGTVLDTRTKDEGSPAETREHAYELLVLADLAEQQDQGASSGA